MATANWNIRLLEPSFWPWRPTKPPSRRIAVLVSGGVDSSVAAGLLAEAGWDVLGLTMKIPRSRGAPGRGCCGADGALVCNELGIPHYFIDVTEPFERLVIGRFRAAYAAGKTPNPCIDCNCLLKFSVVWDFVRAEFGIHFLATGHYARVLTIGGEPRLVRAEDRSKDQSYFLYGIPAERLKDFVLPLGRLAKPEVRRIAARLGLSVSDKPESMELCFAGEGDYRLALGDARAGRAGDITDMRGNKIGRHKGISNYTLGQRRGIGLAGGKPLYVGRIDAATNTIAVGTREEVCTRLVTAGGLNVLIRKELVPGGALAAKIRSYGEPQPCRILEASAEHVTVEFERPQFAPCPGQRLVLYDRRDCVVAGGTITAPPD